MKTPQVDYRKFRLSKIKDPQYSHLKLLLGWVGYFLLYFLTENLIPAEKCTPVHMWLDDVIPFCEWFLIPYVFWYALIVFSFVQTEAMPKEYATCSDGQTPVLVSKLYSKPTQRVRKLSLANISGRRSCRVG